MNVVVLDQSVLPIEVLYSHLATAVDLHAQMKHAHLIERGAGSIAIRKLYERVLGDIEDYSDRLAELALAFDGPSSDRVQAEPAQAISIASSYEACFRRDQRHLVDVTAALLDFGGTVQTAIDENIHRGDEVTAHLFTEVLRDIGEQLSVVETYLAPTKTGL